MINHHQEEETYCHDLERGDHVIRWTTILIYPFQVHGIVLSAGPNIVTIVDFGLTATKSQREDGSKETFDQDKQLEDRLDHEDKTMIKTCEEHRKKHKGKDRVHIVTLVDEKEIRQWKKVHYGESLQKQQNWRWWKRREEHVEEGVTTSSTTETVPSLNSTSEHIELCQEKKATTIGGWWNCTSASKDRDASSSSNKEDGSQRVPKLPKSDPIFLVLSRVRYILNNPHELPAFIFKFRVYSCILQNGSMEYLASEIFLYSTAAGNLKTAILSSAGIAGATTTVTVPAGGIAGWFGMTTTTTVSLLSVQPWLIPVLAGYGLIAVGTPMVLAAKAKEKWEDATIRLNDGFWSSADSDVYV
eukprot:CAMPEP_0176493518 /NCGR_PEP_ID=MMETSP0200_2-20121128/9590_1 /TAXON_ID=947934 /ORGANISM="Chaetoceros sp., Strain GSL56" /LENGTH=357 /DNA_ID=CAMNT_0017891183 /DNA_START=20 /DNA_END=1090 /DNA_ORIENTATION=-